MKKKHSTGERYEYYPDQPLEPVRVLSSEKTPQIELCGVCGGIINSMSPIEGCLCLGENN